MHVIITNCRGLEDLSPCWVITKVKYFYPTDAMLRVTPLKWYFLSILKFAKSDYWNSLSIFGVLDRVIFVLLSCKVWTGFDQSWTHKFSFCVVGTHWAPWLCNWSTHSVQCFLFDYYWGVLYDKTLQIKYNQNIAINIARKPHQCWKPHVPPFWSTFYNDNLN